MPKYQRIVGSRARLGELIEPFVLGRRAGLRSRRLHGLWLFDVLGLGFRERDVGLLWRRRRRRLLHGFVFGLGGLWWRRVRLLHRGTDRDVLILDLGRAALHRRERHDNGGWNVRCRRRARPP